jgi:hypothetical protein
MRADWGPRARDRGADYSPYPFSLFQTGDGRLSEHISGLRPSEVRQSL